MSENEHPVDLLPELALGVLGDDEASPLRAHLKTCESCATEFGLMDQAARFLPYAAEETDARPGMREGLMERIASEPRRLQPRTARPAWQRFTAIAAAAAVLIAAGGVAGLAFGGGGDSSLEQEASRQRTLVRAVADGDARRDTAEIGDLRATLVYAPGAESAFARMEGLPSLPEGKAYQAWFIADGPALPSDVFRSAEEGVWLSSPDAVARFSAFAVTIEDEGGVKVSKEEPVLVLPLGQSASARQPFTLSDWFALTMRD